MRTASICPTCATYTNALCTLYNGQTLNYIDVHPLDSLQTALININAAIDTYKFDPTLNETITGNWQFQGEFNVANGTDGVGFLSDVGGATTWMGDWQGNVNSTWLVADDDNRLVLINSLNGVQINEEQVATQPWVVANSFNPSSNQTITGDWQFENGFNVGGISPSGFTRNNQFTSIGDWQGLSPDYPFTTLDIDASTGAVQAHPKTAFQVWGTLAGMDMETVNAFINFDGSVSFDNGNITSNGIGRLSTKAIINNEDNWHIYDNGDIDNAGDLYLSYNNAAGLTAYGTTTMLGAWDAPSGGKLVIDNDNYLSIFNMPTQWVDGSNNVNAQIGTDGKLQVGNIFYPNSPFFVGTSSYPDGLIRVDETNNDLLLGDAAGDVNLTSFNISDNQKKIIANATNGFFVTAPLDIRTQSGRAGITTPNSYTSILGAPSTSGNGTQIVTDDNEESVKIFMYDYSNVPRAEFFGNGGGSLANQNINWYNDGSITFGSGAIGDNGSFVAIGGQGNFTATNQYGDNFTTIDPLNRIITLGDATGETYPYTGDFNNTYHVIDDASQIQYFNSNSGFVFIGGNLRGLQSIGGDSYWNISNTGVINLGDGNGVPNVLTLYPNGILGYNADLDSYTFNLNTYTGQFSFDNSAIASDGNGNLNTTSYSNDHGSNKYQFGAWTAGTPTLTTAGYITLNINGTPTQIVAYQ